MTAVLIPAYEPNKRLLQLIFRLSYRIQKTVVFA